MPASGLLGAEGEGFTVAMNAMDYGRLTVSARAVGLAQACLDAPRSPTPTRGSPSGRRSAASMVKQLADMTCGSRPPARSSRPRPRRRQGVCRPPAELDREYYAADVANRAAQATAVIFGRMAFSDELPIGLYLQLRQAVANRRGVSETSRRS